MLLVIADFRAAFPEFADIARYPDAMITFWDTFAEAQVRECVWKTQRLMGIQLFVAHEITMAAQNQAAGVIGGTPGAQSGPMNSKTVGSVTASYDTQMIAERDGGWWNQTSYGRAFLRFARMFGAQVIQL